MKLYKNQELFDSKKIKFIENNEKISMSENIQKEQNEQIDPKEINSEIEKEKEISSNDSIDLLLAENITMTKEKIYQIFFIYGDIIDILLLKDKV